MKSPQHPGLYLKNVLTYLHKYSNFAITKLCNDQDTNFKIQTNFNNQFPKFISSLRKFNFFTKRRPTSLQVWKLEFVSWLLLSFIQPV